MKREFKIDTSEELGEFVGLCEQYVLQGKPIRLSLSVGRDRSAEQNRLMWQWARDVSDQTGYTPEEVQAEWKANYGIPILSRDDENMHEVFGRIPWKEGDRESIMRMLRFLPVTSEMTVKQMTELLELVHEYHTRFGIVLTDPDRVV